MLNHNAEKSVGLQSELVRSTKDNYNDQEVSTLNNKIVEQINREYFSSYLYTQISIHCNFKGYTGAADFFKKQALEEMSHMYRLSDYLVDCKGIALTLGDMQSPKIEIEQKEPVDFLMRLFELAYQHEKMISYEINQLTMLALEQQCYSTFQFLQWFVQEQLEEEKLFKSIIDDLKKVSGSQIGAYLIDQDLKRLVAAPAMVNNRLSE